MALNQGLSAVNGLKGRAERSSPPTSTRERVPSMKMATTMCEGAAHLKGAEGSGRAPRNQNCSEEIRRVQKESEGMGRNLRGHQRGLGARVDDLFGRFGDVDHLAVHLDARAHGHGLLVRALHRKLARLRRSWESMGDRKRPREIAGDRGGVIRSPQRGAPP